MFYTCLSVILFAGGVGSAPHRQTWGADPLGRPGGLGRPPWMQTPQGRTPRMQNPPDADLPRRIRLQMGGTRPTGMHTC